jgi:thiol-disulfide isomerase/thioredoxin
VVINPSFYASDFTFIFFLMANVVLGQSNVPTNLNIDSLLTAKRTAPLGKPFPSFTVRSGGNTLSNKLFKGKTVLINFWFEGCHPCMAEMEALGELQERLKDNKDFLFISFTWDNPEAIKRVKEKYGIAFPVIETTDEECHKLNFGNGYPTNIIVDKTGKIKYLHSGGSTNKTEAREFIMTTLLSAIKSDL